MRLIRAFTTVFFFSNEIILFFLSATLIVSVDFFAPIRAERCASVSTYVEQEDTREVINIEELNASLSKIVINQQELREAIDRIIKEIEG